MTTEKKTRQPHAKSKAAQIRKLSAQGKLTPKQIAEKVGVRPAYVHVLRSRMKAEGVGLPAVLSNRSMPVPGGIQEVTTPRFMVRVEEAERMNRHIHSSSPALRPAHVVIERPPLWERVKERIRAWLA